MSTTVFPLEYLLPADLAPDDLGRRLGNAPGVTDTGVKTVERTLLDTADWRLYRHGTFAETRADDRPQFLWRRRLDGRVLGQWLGATPRFAWNLPPSALRRGLQDVIDVRALLPQARLRTRTTGFVVRDRHAKIVLRLRIEEDTLPGDASPPLRPRLCLEPVKGYAKALARAQRTLLEPFGLEPAAADWVTETLAALGITPVAAAPKSPVLLAPEMLSAEAARALLLPLLETIEANEAGAIADLDSEFLHDLRVAVRRTRAALGQFKRVLPPARVAHFRTEFAWLGAVTTPTRDLDVYQLNFPTYQANLPAEEREHLEPLRAFLTRHQQAAQQQLARHLASRRYRKLKQEWRRFLQAPPETGSDSAPHAAQPVLELAQRRITKLYRRALQEGAQLRADSPAEAFHELRKTCKKLRYTVEFFQSLLAADACAAFLKTLKALQDNLGVYNDLAVQSVALTQFGQAMQQEGSAPARCLMAMGTLVEDFNRRKALLRAEFAPLFQQFSATGARTRLRALFATPVDASEKGAHP